MTTYSILLGLVPNVIRKYAYLIMVGVILSVIGFAVLKYKNALDTIDKIEQQKISLERDKKLLQDTNAKNEAFIKTMNEDNERRDKIVSEFRAQKIKDDQKLSALSKTLSSYAADQDGPIAKVLKDAVLGIHADRQERLK